jgi:hypothetical protein
MAAADERRAALCSYDEEEPREGANSDQGLARYKRSAHFRLKGCLHEISHWKEDTQCFSGRRRCADPGLSAETSASHELR